MKAPDRLPRWLHLPLPLLVLGAGIAYGYVSCETSLGFELLICSPLLVHVAVLLATVSTGIVAWRTPKGWRTAVAGLHVLILLVSGALIREIRPLGQWGWEKRVLGPRTAALRNYSMTPSDNLHRPVTIDGYQFAGFEQTSQGSLFYTEVLGGPWCSRGIFVPRAGQAHHLPATVASITPTSVPGLFWFMTKD